MGVSRQINLNGQGTSMEYKVLERQDVQLMKYFVDDQNTAYDEALLHAFLEEKYAYAYVAKENDRIVGFAYGYVLLRPDGLKDFYLHAIDITESDRQHGYGTGLMKYISAHAKEIGCRKLFLITNRDNVAACRCYEHAGGVTTADDDVVYMYK